MSDALRDKVEERVERILRAAEEGATTRAEDLFAITAVVETALVLARREGWNLRAYQSENITEFPGAVESGMEKFPLPTRTRQSLREEPVPGEGEGAPLFRVRDDVLEWTPNPSGNVAGKRWHAYAAWYAGKTDTRAWGRIAHALDLHANPYRTYEVPGDESDPWGERGGR